MEDEVEDIIEDLEELGEAEEEEDEPDAPPKKKAKRPRKEKAPREKKERVGIGTAEVAAAAGIEQRALRLLLREEFPKTGVRYEWKSLNDPQVRQILKRIKGGAVKEMESQRLARVKEKASSKTTTRRRRRKAAVEEEEE